MDTGQFIFLGLPFVFAAGIATYVFVEDKALFTVKEHCVVLLIGIGVFLLGVALNLILGYNLKETVVFENRTPAASKLFFFSYIILLFGLFNIFGNLIKYFLQRRNEIKKRRRYRVRT